MFLAAHEKILSAGSTAGVLTTDDWIIDIAGRSVSAMRGKCPCITRGHAAALGYYSTARQRKLTLPELMLLQGVDPQRLVFPPAVPERQARCMVGKAFCVPVAANIIDRILYAIGKTAQPVTFKHAKRHANTGGEAGNNWLAGSTAVNFNGVGSSASVGSATVTKAGVGSSTCRRSKRMPVVVGDDDDDIIN